jgi:hypothetical protein
VVGMGGTGAVGWGRVKKRIWGSKKPALLFVPDGDDAHSISQCPVFSPIRMLGRSIFPSPSS